MIEKKRSIMGFSTFDVEFWWEKKGFW